jgi:hypothetical protein
MRAARHVVLLQILAFLAALAACGSPAKPAETPKAAGDAAKPAPAGAVDDEHPGEAQCEELLDHTLKLLLEQMRQTQDPETIPTEQQVAQIRAKMRESEFDLCLQGSVDLVRCGLAASTVEELRACEDPGQQ